MRANNLIVLAETLKDRSGIPTILCIFKQEIKKICPYKEQRLRFVFYQWTENNERTNQMCRLKLEHDWVFTKWK